MRRSVIPIVAVILLLLWTSTVVGEAHRQPGTIISTNCEACNWQVHAGGMIVYITCVFSPGSGQSDCWTHSGGCSFTSGCSTVYGGGSAGSEGTLVDRSQEFEAEADELIANHF